MSYVDRGTGVRAHLAPSAPLNEDSPRARDNGGEVDPKYGPYIVADSNWYEPLERCDDAASQFSLANRELPVEWKRGQYGVWEVLAPIGGQQLPEQGWKIHITATPDTAEEVIEQTWAVCRRLNLPWKFLRSRRIATVLNSKYANRAASGKVVTVYPRDAEELHTALTELDAVLGGRPGPYVLSDHRWNKGPVSVRYGAFALMWCELPDGSRVPALRDPQGNAVPDRRRPAFTVPEWAETPEFLAASLAAADEDTAATLNGYTVLKALHFSNGGGVYLAKASDGTQVVLKEARPHAGLDAGGADAVDRLRNEWSALKTVGHLPFVPRPIEYFTAWEHHYLAMEHIQGQSLSTWMGRDYPLTRHAPDERARAEYTTLALDHLGQAEAAIETLHKAGMAFGDLHPHNILIRDDGTVALVDFEIATAVDTERTAVLGAPGFIDLSLTNARDSDLFSLGCCQLSAFVPLTGLVQRTPAVIGHLIEMATTAFPALPAAYVERMVERLALSPSVRPHLPGHRSDAVPTLAPPRADSLLRGIGRSADTTRTDRLFPGDIAGHREGATLGLAYGTPGILLAQLSAGSSVDPEHLAWLEHAARRAPARTPLGLYDGLAGTAWLLHRLDNPLGEELIDRILSSQLPSSPGLFNGLTGIAHLLLDAGKRDEALKLAAAVRERIGEEGVLDRPGLMYGWSGPAVLLARCSRLTGDGDWAEAAALAVRADLRHARQLDGTLQMSSSQRLLPYLAEGSAGVALAAMALPEAQATAIGADDIVAGAARATAVQTVVQGGLFNGRAGNVYFLSHAAAHVPQARSWAEHQLRLLSVHVADHGGEQVLYGDQLLRLSADLATGSAGLLLAMEAAKTSGGRLLPGAHPDQG
ncbi:class III lanthionine synthetase LanKC [Streptomyces chattanoogensis]|uniref:class III lanthionine synthetase LanKC n=1 Tax=Streptomyces chattanoogensis TaxID=66876 RepID=UPI00099D7194|nr:class III lanthionine synthetase LanKC [Streptomyces chattanoogensis]